MESMPLQIEKLLGVSNGENAGQVFSGRIAFADGTIGTIVSCILVASSKGEDAQSATRDIYDIAIKKLESASGSILTPLADARETAVNHISSKGIDAGFVHLVFYKQAVYVVRSQDFVKVLVFDGQKSFEVKFENGSGPVKVGQIYVVASEKFIKEFKPGDFLKADVNLEETVDGLATAISAKEDSSEIAAAFVLVKDLPENSDIKQGEEPAVLEDDETKEEVKIEDNSGPSDGSKEDLDSDDKEKAREDKLEGAKSGVAASGAELFEELRPVLGRRISIEAFLKGIFSAFLGEVKKVRSGDLRAILRFRRSTIIVAVILVAILIASVSLSIKHKQDAKTEANFNDLLLSASSEYSDGDGLVSLNKSRAREILVRAASDVDKALSIKKSDARALDLKQKIANKLKETEEMAAVSFKNLAQVDGTLVGLGIVNKNLIGISQNKIYTVDADGKTLDNFDGANGANSAYIFDNNVFELSGKEVYKVDISSKKSEKIIDADVAADIGVFIGNVYLLGKTQIYKYTPIDKGYAKSADYLEAPQGFDAASHLAIDGNVWVTSGGEILKFLRGSKEDFNISGLVSGDHKFGEIYTTGDLDNLYIVDIVNRALLVISKDGTYRKAYQGDEFAKASGIVVDEGAGKIYLAVENKILEAEL